MNRHGSRPGMHRFLPGRGASGFKERWPVIISHLKIKIAPTDKAWSDEKAQSRHGVMSILKRPTTQSGGDRFVLRCLFDGYQRVPLRLVSDNRDKSVAHVINFRKNCFGIDAQNFQGVVADLQYHSILFHLAE